MIFVKIVYPLNFDIMESIDILPSYDQCDSMLGLFQDDPKILFEEAQEEYKVLHDEYGNERWDFTD